MKYKIKVKGSQIMSIKLPEKFEKIVTNSKQEWLDTRGMTRDELRTLIEGRVIRDQEVSPKVVMLLTRDQPYLEVRDQVMILIVMILILMLLQANPLLLFVLVIRKALAQQGLLVRL